MKLEKKFPSLYSSLFCLHDIFSTVTFFAIHSFSYCGQYQRWIHVLQDMAIPEKHDTSKPGSFPSFPTKQLLQMPGISTPPSLLECENPLCLSEEGSDAEVLFNPSKMIPGVGEVICVRCDAHWTVCLSCNNVRVQRFAPGMSPSLQDHLRKLP